MQKPTEKHKASKAVERGPDGEPLASRTDAPSVKAWPFAPGSQLGSQVAKVCKPKLSYRFNQR